MDMINRSPIISSPLNLFDCSPISDGASAVVLSRDRKSDRDVEVIGSDLAYRLHLFGTEKRDYIICLLQK